MKKLLLAVCAVVCVAAAHAQTTTITGTHINTRGSLISDGTVTFTAVDIRGVPIPSAGPVVGLNGPEAVTCQISNGAIVQPCAIPDAQLTTPGRLLYQIQITNSATEDAFTMQAVPNITGASWALDAYAPPANTTNAQQSQVAYGTIPPPTSCTAPSFYVRNYGGGQLYICVGGGFVAVAGSSGGAFTGGALTNSLLLAGDPTTALGAATKQYVDAHAGGAFNGGAVSNAITLPSDPQADLQAATKRYVDAHSATFSGGTVANPIVLPSDPTLSNQATTKNYVDTHVPANAGHATVADQATTAASATNASHATAADTATTASTASALASGAKVSVTQLAPDPTANASVTYQAGTGGDSSCPTPAAGKTLDCYFAATNSVQRSVNGGGYAPIASGGGSGITALTSDVQATGTGSQPATVVGINGTPVTSMTGLVKFTNGIPSTAGAPDITAPFTGSGQYLRKDGTTGTPTSGTGTPGGAPTEGQANVGGTGLGGSGMFFGAATTSTAKPFVLNCLTSNLGAGFDSQCNNLTHYVSGPGINYGAGVAGVGATQGWSTSTGLSVSEFISRRGIANGVTVRVSKYADGDLGGFYGYIFSKGGATDGSGEGVQGMKINAGQLPGVFAGTVGQPNAAGLTVSATQDVQGAADGAPLINTLAPITTGNILAETISSPTVPGTLTTDNTLTVATGIGTVPGAISVPSGGGTATVAVAAGTGAFSLGGGTIYFGCNDFMDQVTPTAVSVSGSTATITGFFRFSHAAGCPLVTQGGMHDFLDITADRRIGLGIGGNLMRTAYWVVATGPHTFSTRIYLAGGQASGIYPLAHAWGSNGAYTLWPGAEIVGVHFVETVANGVVQTRQFNGQVDLAPHDVVFASTNPVENPPNPSFSGQGFGIDYTANNPPTNSGITGGTIAVHGVGISSNATGLTIQNLNLFSMYTQGGGTLTPPIAALPIAGTWTNILTAPGAVHNGSILAIDRTADGCADPTNDKYNLWLAQTSSQAFSGYLDCYARTFSIGFNAVTNSRMNFTLAGPNIQTSLSPTGSPICTADGTNCPASNGGTVSYGTTAGTAAQGNDSRILNALQTGVANAAANGTTDDTAALNVPLASGKDAYLSPGVNYLVGTSTTWTGVVHPLSGAKILVATGVTLTINTRPAAAATPWITLQGTGRVVFGPAISDPPVEWLGAVADYNGTTGTDNTTTIQACLDAITAGQCVLHAGTYKTTAALSITKSNTGIRGSQAGYTYPNPKAASIIMQITAGADILDVTGTGSAFVAWTDIEDLSLQRSVVPTGTAKGLALNFVGGLTMKNVQSEDSINDFYFHATPNYGTGSIEKTSAGFGFYNAVNYPVGDYYGYFLDSTDGVPENTIVITNAGTGVNGGSFGTLGTTHGTLIQGAAMNDVDMTKMSSAGTSYGMEINYIPGSTSNAAPASDIHCNFCTFDDFSITGVKVTNITPAARGLINFDGGWAASLRTGTQNAVEVDNSSATVTFSNMQLINGHGIGAYLYRSSHVKMTGDSLLAMGTAGIATQQVTNSIFSHNLLVGDQTFPTGNFFNIAGASTNNIFTANSVSGYGTTGFDFDATSIGNKFCSNNVDTANLTGAAFAGAGYADTCSGSTSSSSPTTSAVFSDAFSGTGPLNPGWAQTTSTNDALFGPITSAAGTATSGATHHGVAFYTGGSYAFDQFSEATIPTTGGYNGLIVRGNVAYTAGYLWSTSDKAIYNIPHLQNNTAPTFITASCPTVAAGDKIRLTAVGSTITCLDVTTGVSASATDTSFTSGYVGIATGSNVPVGPWRGGSGGGN